MSLIFILAICSLCIFASYFFLNIFCRRKDFSRLKARWLTFGLTLLFLIGVPTFTLLSFNSSAYNFYRVKSIYSENFGNSLSSVQDLRGGEHEWMGYGASLSFTTAEALIVNHPEDYKDVHCNGAWVLKAGFDALWKRVWKEHPKSYGEYSEKMELLAPELQCKEGRVAFEGRDGQIHYDQSRLFINKQTHEVYFQINIA